MHVMAPVRGSECSMPVSPWYCLHGALPVCPPARLQRSVLVDKPDLGYGEKGLGELPPNQTFELRIEVLDVLPKK